MFIFSKRKFFVFTVFSLCFSQAFAVLEHHDDDLRDSRSSFLISGENYAELSQKFCGALTLCFAGEKAAFVFEVFSPQKPLEVLLRMVTTESADRCFGWSQKHLATIHNADITLKNVYRAYDISSTGLEKKYQVPLYTRYATWILSNDILIQALNAVEAEERGLLTSKNVSYIEAVMRKVGFQNLQRQADLKVNATTHVIPHPDRVEGRFSALPNF